MIHLRVYGQCPSKKSSQQIIRLKGKKGEEVDIERYAERLVNLSASIYEQSGDTQKFLKAKRFIEDLLKSEVKSSGGGMRLIPNKLYVLWESPAIRQLKNQMKEQGLSTITEPVWVKTLVYRNTKRKIDKGNLEQSIHDVLQKAGVIKDDFQIESTDGSRRILGVPAGEERAEIFISSFY